ncbi:MAG: sugar transferase [Flavobacteriales bacterium]|nr:sugar transferase [Flavobacteriales bacterium]
MKRMFDFFCALVFLILLSPVLFFVAILVLFSSPGGALFSQIRVGKNAKEFRMHKFRSMRKVEKDDLQLTIGQDSRITRTGAFIRKYKLDELPQLWNILMGEMSFIGPRPEVPKYVALYNEEQKKVLSVRPGLSDPASLAYLNEAEILAKADDPEKEYVGNIMPAKLALNLKYIEERSFLDDLGLMLKTVGKVFG